MVNGYRSLWSAMSATATGTTAAIRRPRDVMYVILPCTAAWLMTSAREARTSLVLNSCASSAMCPVYSHARPCTLVYTTVVGEMREAACG